MMHNVRNGTSSEILATIDCPKASFDERRIANQVLSLFHAVSFEIH